MLCVLPPFHRFTQCVGLTLASIFICEFILVGARKREIFVTELYTPRDPIWVGDLGTEAKNPFV
jgi:hypothetical protein